MVLFGIACLLATLTLAFMVRWVWHDNPDLLAPSVLLLIYLAAAYVLDPIYIALTRTYGFNDKYTYRLGSGQLSNLAYIVMLATIAILAFGIGLGWGKRYRVDAQLLQVTPRTRPRILSSVRSGVTIGLAFVVTVVGLVSAFRAQASSVTDAIRWIGNKQALYEGRGYLQLLVLAFKASILIWSASVLSRWRSIGKIERFSWAAAVVTTFLVDLATGTRSNLLFSNILVVLLLFHRLHRPIRPLWLLYVGPLAFAVLITVRVFTRDIFFREYRGRGAAALVLEKLSSVPRTLLFEEIQSADAQLLALESPLTPPPLWGRTLAATLTLPIPRALYRDKPRGGNAWFTQTYFPVRYYVTRVEMTSSFLTELWVNFRLGGVLAGFCILGIAVALLEDLGKKRYGPLLECMYAVVVWRFISLLRGDVFNWVINVVGMCLLLYVAFVFMSRIEPKLDS